MKKNIFIATVKIAFEADNEGAASDKVSAMLSECLEDELNYIIDWQYEASPDYDEMGPKEIGEINLKGIEEGEIFAKAIHLLTFHP